jgi:preprotein translocase subunit SecE
VQQLKRFKQFLIDVWAELKKTTWPAKREVYGTTLVVIVTVLICAFFLWIVDQILTYGMSLILPTAGQ